MKIFDLLDNIHRGNSRDRNREFVRGKLVNYRLYGYLCEYVDESKLNNYLKRLVKLNGDDKWALFKIMAVGDKEYNKKSPENTSFAFGDVAVLVSGQTPINDWYQIEGNVRTVLYDGTGEECYICNMRKQNEKWCIEQPFFDNLDLNLVSNEIYKCILQSEESGIFTQPTIPRGMYPVRCIGNYEGVFKKSTISTPEPITSTQSESIASMQSTPSVEETTFGTQQNIGIDEEDLLGINETPANEVNKSKEQVDQEAQSCKKIELKGLGEDGSLLTNKLTFGKGLIEFDKVPAKNIDWSEVRYKERKIRPIENRKEKLPKTEKYEILNEVSQFATQTREDVFDRLLKEYDAVSADIHKSDMDEFLKLLSCIRSNSNRKPKGVGTSGSALIKNYIKKQKSSEMACTMGTLYDTLVMNGTDRLISYMQKRGTQVGEKVSLNIPDTDEMGDIMYEMFPTDIQGLYAGLYASLLGLSVEDFIETGCSCRDLGLSFIKIVSENPYLLMLVNEDIKFLDLELMANARGLHSKSVETWRLVCILHDMLNNYKGSTAFNIYELAKNRVSYSIGKRGLAKIRNFNSLMNEEQKANIQTYVDSNLTDEMFKYTAADFNSYGVSELTQDQLQRAIIAYVNAGLGIVYKGTLYNTSMLKEDIDIYNTVWSRAVEDKKLDMGKVDEAIEKFESKKSEELGFEFRLEKEQRDACYMVNQKVLCVTGPAGSGKTTTVEAMIFVRNYCSNKTETIVYAAPTGKAANRLQEVVKEPVKTQHSMFKIFSSAGAEMGDYLDEDAGTASADIYVFDEQAMVGTKLMSRVLKGMKKKSSVFFIGDVEQLVPIERGKPFADFLTFLPTVRLRVSKRSIEGSDLSNNISRIIDKSDRRNFEALSSGYDTELIDCKTEFIVEHIRNIVNHHLGYEVDNRLDTDFINSLGILDADDIQVASPVVSDRFSWGCNKMNVMLQDIFNPSKGIDTPEISYGFGENMDTIRLGSRVIHVNNNYSLRHYSKFENGCTLHKKDKAGVMNGDVGKVVAIGRGEDFEEIGIAPKSYDGRPVEDNAQYFNMDYAIVVVKYRDSEDMEDYYVVYRAPIDLYATLGNKIICKVPGKLKDIQLAYALSIHKLQGSEAKLIIFTCSTGLRLGDFLNRNLVYTAVSRAKRGLYVVGSISTVEKAREFSATNMRHSAMEEFI